MWTYGESNPDLVHAMDAFYRYTIGPSEKQGKNTLYSYFFRATGLYGSADIGPCNVLILTKKSFSVVCSHEESNLDYGIRNPAFYPLNYGSVVTL